MKNNKKERDSSGNDPGAISLIECWSKWIL
jgi:hypothetical protein